MRLVVNISRYHNISVSVEDQVDALTVKIAALTDNGMYRIRDIAEMRHDLRVSSWHGPAQDGLVKVNNTGCHDICHTCLISLFHGT